MLKAQYIWCCTMPSCTAEIHDEQLRQTGEYSSHIQHKWEEGIVCRSQVTSPWAPRWKSQLPPVGKRACSSLVTASMNEKQLQGMLHYHPISGMGGGELVDCLQAAAVCRIPCLKVAGGVNGIGLQTCNWVEQPPPLLTRPCTSSFV